jgi:hypothetical protein
MRAAELIHGPRYPEYLRAVIERSARTRKVFSRPDSQTDRLFKPEHDHPGSENSCDGCPAEWEETRSPRESSDPETHYGIVASANWVIKHGGTREQLRSMTGALCFDMEAAGLMNDLPCIIIRGICDYADSHKHKHWQGFAALAAASYTKELLEYVPDMHASQGEIVADMSSQTSFKCAQLTRAKMDLIPRAQSVTKATLRAFSQRNLLRLGNHLNPKLPQLLFLS